MMDQWSKTYHKDTGVEVNYQSKGSSAGIEQMTDKSVDFGCSDAPMNAHELEKAHAAGGEVLHIPLVMGAAVPAFNLEGVDDLRFTGPLLADIYIRKVTKWNDPALAAINPGVKLPDKEIKVVHRSDGSGTTYMWTEYLSKVSPEWEKKLHFGTSVNWPEGTLGEKGTEGVAKNVSSTPGAIGYIELFYALKNHIKFGAVQNQAGEFVLANLDSVTEAAKAAAPNIPADLRYSLVNMPGKGAYPISGTTWAILYVQQPPEKGKALVEFLRWVTHQGQEMTKDLSYARLPSELVQRIDNKLAEIKYGQ
jgi:phosphate transport system substrate-binding protein